MGLQRVDTLTATRHGYLGNHEPDHKLFPTIWMEANTRSDELYK